MMLQTLPLQPFPHAGLRQEIHRALLQNSGAHAIFHVPARTAFNHHRLDALQTQQVRKRQARRTRTNNAYLRSQGSHFVKTPFAQKLQKLFFHFPGDCLAHKFRTVFGLAHRPHPLLHALHRQRVSSK